MAETKRDPLSQTLSLSGPAPYLLAPRRGDQSFRQRVEPSPGLGESQGPKFYSDTLTT